MEKIKKKLNREYILILALIIVSIIVNCIYLNDNMQIGFNIQFIFDANLLYISIYCTYLACITIFDKQLSVEGNVYKSKNLIIPIVFLIILTYTLNYLLFYTDVMSSFSIWLSKYRIQFDYFYRFVLLAPILLIYIFQIKIHEIKWTITWKQLSVILLMGISLICILLFLGYKVVLSNNYIIMDKLITALRMLFYPALYEELLYRGLFIGVLLGYGFNENKANVIQAIIFALSHWTNYRFFGLVMIVKILCFIIPGLLFGKLYLKTKSLALTTLLHGLHNSILMFFGI